MYSFGRVLGTSLLILAAAPAITAQDPSLRKPSQGIQLSYLGEERVLQMQTLRDGTAFMFVGPLAPTPIPIMGIELNVLAGYLVPLGAFAAGDTVSFSVPAKLGDLNAEAVLFPPDFSVLDSNVVSLQGLDGGSGIDTDGDGIVDADRASAIDADRAAQIDSDRAAQSDADRANTTVTAIPIAPVDSSVQTGSTTASQVVRVTPDSQ